MILSILSTLAFFAWLILTSFFVLAALSYRYRYNEAVRTANFNAEAWATADRARFEAEIEAASLRGSLDTSRDYYNQMSGVARQAIKASEEVVGVPEELRIDSSDSILDADEIS